MDPRRRALLASIGAGTAALAGCTSRSDRSGSDSTADETDPSPTTTPVGESASQPSVFAAVPADQFTAGSGGTTLTRTRPRRLRAGLDWLTDEARSRMESVLTDTTAAVAIEAQRLGVALTGAGTVLRGQFGQETVVENHETALERAGTDGEYDLYHLASDPDGSPEVAVTDGQYLAVRGDVTRMLGAERGRVDGLDAVADGLERHLVAFLSTDLSQHVVYATPVPADSGDVERGRFPGQHAASLGFGIREEEVTLTVRLLFASADAAAAAAVEEWVASNTSFDEYELSPSRDGASVAASGTVPTAEFTLLGSEAERADRTPQAAFSFDRQGEELTITHTSGDAIRADRLTVYVGERAAEPQFDGATVQAGDRVTVDVSGVDSGTTVRVIWSDGDGSTVLAQYDLR